MKILLFAFTNWGLVALTTLMETNHQILCVYTHPMDMDKNEKIWFDSVTEECNRNNILVKEKTKLNTEDEKFIKSLNPDIIISANWRRLIPKSIYQTPKYRTINIHAGYLPKYRGFAPINWAIINGEKEIAVTVHYVDEKPDTGDIIVQKKISVDINDTATDIYNQASTSLPNLIHETLLKIESNEVKPISQKGKKGFLCVKRFPEDGKIDWSQNRLDIYNLIRALSDPFPNAFCFLNGEKIYIKKATLIEEDFRGPPGRICEIRDEGIIVTCGNDHKNNQTLLINEMATDKGHIVPKEYFTKRWLKLE